MDTFIALIRLPVGDADWHAEFPDLPGCTATGGSLDQAIEAARDALTTHIAELVSGGGSVPVPRDPADMLIAANEDPGLARRVVGTVVTAVEPRPAAALRYVVRADPAADDSDARMHERRIA